MRLLEKLLILLSAMTQQFLTKDVQILFELGTLTAS